MRINIVFKISCLQDASTSRAIKCLRDFMLTHFGNQYMVIFFREFYRATINMQTWIRNQLVVRYSKIEVMINFWDKLLGRVMEKAIKIKDKDIKGVCHEIIQVPKEVREACLLAYIN